MNRFSLSAAISIVLASVPLAACAHDPAANGQNDSSAWNEPSPQLADGDEPGARGSAEVQPQAFAAPDDNCSTSASEARRLREAAITEALFANHCVPRSFDREPCRGLYAEWERIKSVNAECNAAASGISVCEYYANKVEDYEAILAECNANGWTNGVVDPGMWGAVGSYFEACAYALMSLEYFARMANCELFPRHEY
jgi:hypothetical protein